MKELIPIIILIIEALKVVFKKDKSALPLSIELMQAKSQDDVAELVKRIGDEWNAKANSNGVLK